jgi:alpha-beta hydrolase superfamily lysophospholipase
MRARAPAVIMAAAALAAAMAGCAGPRTAPAGGPVSGGPGRGAAARPLSAPAQQCGQPAAPGRVITVRAADGVPLATIEAGAGDRAVVLIPELGQRGKCGWWAFAAYLAAHGYHVLAFDHRCTGASSCPAGAAAEADLMSDIRGAAAWLRQHGATRVALVGASQGGSEALIAATVPAPGITGVAALSADELTTALAAPPYPATAVAAVPRLRLPVLLAVAAGDPYVSVPDTRSLLARAGSPGKRLVVLPAGAGHGWDLVTPLFPDGAPSALSGTVLAFLGSVTA